MTTKQKTIIERIKETVEWINSWDKKTLQTIRGILFFAILGDLIGLFWYLGWKRIGGAVFVVILVLMGLIIMLEQQKGGVKTNKMAKCKHCGSEIEESEEEQDSEAEEDDSKWDKNEARPENRHGAPPLRQGWFCKPEIPWLPSYY